MKDFVKAVLAGLFITIAVACYLMISDKIIGSFLFSIALIIILTYDLNLYTGKVGYIVENNFKYILRVLNILIGNTVGVIISSYLISLTKNSDKLFEASTYLVEAKLNDSLLSVFILAIFCGILMYTGVNGFKKIKEDLGKYILVVLCVMVFILCYFEHSIADIAYLNFAGKLFTIEGLIFIIIAVIGNLVGAIFIPLLKKIN